MQTNALETGLHLVLGLLAGFFAELRRLAGWRYGYAGLSLPLGFLFQAADTGSAEQRGSNHTPRAQLHAQNQTQLF